MARSTQRRSPHGASVICGGEPSPQGSPAPPPSPPTRRAKARPSQRRSAGPCVRPQHRSQRPCTPLPKNRGVPCTCALPQKVFSRLDDVLATDGAVIAQHQDTRRIAKGLPGLGGHVERRRVDPEPPPAQEGGTANLQFTPRVGGSAVEALGALADAGIGCGQKCDLEQE